jgi:RNA-binding protein 26
LFGEIADYIVDSTLPSITLNYKTRKEAEMALLKGKHFQVRRVVLLRSCQQNCTFQDRTLSITWCSVVALNNQMTSSRAATRKVLMSESEEDRLIEQNLPEGEEDVSWRVGRERRQFTGVLQLGPEISEEALLQDDEEEEEESEDRSWRR